MDKNKDLLLRFNELIKSDNLIELDGFINTLDNYSIITCKNSITSDIVKAFFISRYMNKLNN